MTNDFLGNNTINSFTNNCWSEKQRLEPLIVGFGDILDSFNDAMLAIDSGFMVIKSNHSFYRTFKVKSDAINGTKIYDLDDQRWNLSQLRTLLENQQNDVEMFIQKKNRQFCYRH